MRYCSSSWTSVSTTVLFFLIIVQDRRIEAFGEWKAPEPHPSSLPSSTVDSTSSSSPNHHDLSDVPSFDDYRSSATWRHVSCNSSQFLCENGRQCIDRVHLCDRIEHCDDGSDEGGKCDECQHENGGCEHQCRNTPNGAECLCHIGWRPTHDGISCEDEDECASGHGYCQHYCHNTKGGFTCSCAAGYNLLSDGSTCKLQEHEAGFVLFSVGHQIRNLPLNSWHDLGPKEKPETAVVCDVRSGMVDGLDTNSNNGHFYYTRNKGIYAHYEAEICVVQGLHQFGNNVAIDWVTGNLYFVKEDPASLGLCTDDGRYCTVLMNREDDLGTPRGLALHPKVGVMFWTDWGDGAKIERANMDGTDRRVIVDTQLVWPNAVAIDYIHNLLYFADSEYNLIERVRLDGSHREVVVRSGVFHPFDLAVFDDHVFWTDWDLHGVMTAKISNESEHLRVLYQGDSMQPYGIGILHPAYQQKDLPNPCKEAACSHICALTTHEYSHGRVSASCLCPSNYVHRDGEKKSECVPTNKTAETGVHWCLDAFVAACQDGSACMNGGTCKLDQNEHGDVVGARCDCPLEFVGDFCEVVLAPADLAVVVAARGSGAKPWVAASLIFLTFVLVTCLCCFVLCRYGQYKSKLQSLRWSPSVIFRKTVMAAKNVKDYEQRQRIISTTEDGLSKGNMMLKTESFANPVYEEVQVPVHQHAYAILTRANSMVSHDSDGGDSGLEFNTSNGSP